MTQSAPPGPAAAPMAREAGRAIFGAGAHGYHAARSGYPAALFAHVRGRSASAPRVLEIGPGSGLATEGLLTLAPAAYVGVESDGDFVAYLRARFTEPAVCPEMHFVHAAFPTPAVAGPFDLAVCAAAFHWLEPEAALAAVRALLRPGGVWAMWWNSYLDPADGAPFAIRAMAILHEEAVPLPPSFTAEGHRSRDVAWQTGLLRAAGLVDIVDRHWTVARPLDVAAATALFESFSFVRALPAAHRAYVLARITRMVAEDFAGHAANVVATHCYTARNPAAGADPRP